MKRLLFAGIDWGNEKHDVCLVDDSGSVLEERQFEHSGEGLVTLTRWLLARADEESERLRVAIEVNAGPVVETLMDRGVSVFSINPKQLDRFRDRFTVAGAKDDRLDARVLADSLRTDGHLFRKVRPVALIGDEAALLQSGLDGWAQPPPASLSSRRTWAASPPTLGMKRLARA